MDTGKTQLRQNEDKQQQQQQQLGRRQRRKVIFPKLINEQAADPGFDGPTHYAHWKLFRQRRTMTIHKHKLVLNHMKHGLRERLDNRITSIEENSESKEPQSESQDLRLAQTDRSMASLEAASKQSSEIVNGQRSDAQQLQDDLDNSSTRSSSLFDKYSAYGVQRTRSTLSTAGELTVDFLNDQQQQQQQQQQQLDQQQQQQQNQLTVQAALNRDPTFVTSFTQAGVSPPSSAVGQRSRTVSTTSSSQAMMTTARILPPIGDKRAPRPGDTLQLFLASADTADADAERAAMAAMLVPRLRHCARSWGLEFALVDPQFGCGIVTDDLHRDAAIVQQQLVASIAQYEHINLVILLGEKYGSSQLPTEITAAEFQQLQSEYAKLHEKLKQLRAERQKELEAAERERKRQEERMQQTRIRQHDETEEEEHDDIFEDLRKQQQQDVKNQQNAKNPKASLPSVARAVGRTVAMSKSFSEEGIRELDGYIFGEDYLQSWYTLDTNSQAEAVYRLRPVHSHIADFRLLRQQQQDQWQRMKRQLCETLRFLTKRLVRQGVLLETESAVLLARRSWLEQLLQASVLRFGHRNCLLFVRSLETLRDSLQQPLAKQFIDLLPNKHEVDMDAVHALTTLKLQLESVIPEDKILRSQLTWATDGGVNPARMKIHENYVRKLCNQICRQLEPQICELGLASMQQQQQLLQQRGGAVVGGGSAVDEVVQENHAFLMQHSRSCIGRKQQLSMVKSYLRSSSMLPLVVHGAAGSGMTTLMASVYSKLNSWLAPGTVSSVRVVGVSSRSTNVRYLLSGVCQELSRKISTDGSDESIPEEFAGVVNELSSLLQQATAERPIVILLDAVCQLNNEYGGRKCQWLPKPLPKNVKIVLTASSGTVLQELQRQYASSSEEHFVELPAIEQPEQLLDSWLQKVDKQLTEEQRNWCLETFNANPLPLTLRLCFHEATRWSSFDEPPNVATRSLKAVIAAYFVRLEAQFGDLLVRRSLAYITAAKNGLLPQELIDILSLDDAVMDVVAAQFHLPVRRCPQILWMRLRDSLGELLVERYFDKSRPLNWAHAVLKEAAAERYLTQKERPIIHKTIAEYFDGMWAGDRKKPHSGNEAGSVRFVCEQPFYFERPDSSNEFQCNERKLSELPWHLRESQQHEALKEKCLCNFEFLLAKLLATSVRHVLDLLLSILDQEPNDKDTRIVYNALYLSRSQLQLDTSQLATQLLGRVTDVVKGDRPRAPADPKKYPFLHQLYYQARRNRDPTLVPSRSCMAAPSEMTLELLQGHKMPVTAACFNEEGSLGFTSSKDETIRIWDLASCRVIRAIPGVGGDVLSITLALNESVIVTSEVTKIRVFAVKQGYQVFEIPVADDPCTISVSGDTNNVICFHHGICVMRTWNLEKLVKICDKQLSEKGLHQDQTIVAASRCNGDLILYGLRGSNFARVVHCRSGADVTKLNCSDKASLVTAVQSSREYYIVACQATDHLTRIHMFFLELFDTKSGKMVRRIKGCLVCSVVQQLLLTNIQQHVISLNPMREKNMTDIVAWNLETEEHKHFSRHPGISDIGAVYDFRKILTGSTQDSSMRLWNAQNSMQAASLKTDKVVGIADIKIDLSNSRYALTKLADNSSIHAWNLAGNKCSGKIVKSAKSIATSSDMVLMDGHSVIVLGSPGFSPKVPNAKFVYQTLKIFDIKKQKFTVNLHNRALIVPCEYHEYRIIKGTQLLCVNEVRSGFTVYSLETGEIIRKIKPDFASDTSKRRTTNLIEGSVLQRENDLFEEFVTSRKNTVFMTPWERRNESQSAKNRRYRNEWEEMKHYEEELEVEKSNCITNFLLSEDQSTLVAAFFAHHLCVFNVSNGTQQKLLQHRSAMLHLFTASLSPDGRYLAHMIYDESKETSQLCLWSCRSGQVKRAFAEGGVGAVAVNNDASIVLLGTEFGYLKLYDGRRSHPKPLIKAVSPAVQFQQNAGNQIRLFQGDSRALVYASSISIWKVHGLQMVSALTPDQPVHSISLGLNDQLVMFAIKDCNDPIILKVLSRDSKRPQRVGRIEYGEVESSDTSEDEDAPVEAKE